jgi:hypothetical protein
VKNRFNQCRSAVAHLLLGAGLWLGSGPAGCTAPKHSEPSPAAATDFRGVEAAERAVRAASPATPDRQGPAAIVNGRQILWEDLRPALSEAAGGLVLQEMILDRLLETETRLKGITINPEDHTREWFHLVEAITREARASEEETERLLATLRQSRGLGEHRFQRLLDRNARLRALIADEVEVTREEIDREFLMRHGERYRARVIMVATQRRAAEIRRQLEEGDGPLHLRFAAAAAIDSIDPSSERGGIVDPISPADPSYPAIIRRTLEHLEPGELSPVLGIDRGFALLLMEERLPGDDAAYDEVEPAIREHILRRHERVAMDALARRLLREANISVTDRALHWSWQSVQER